MDYFCQEKVNKKFVVRDKSKEWMAIFVFNKKCTFYCSIIIPSTETSSYSYFLSSAVCVARGVGKEGAKGGLRPHQLSEQRASAFLPNAHSKFATVDREGVLEHGGPVPRNSQHPCISEVPEATYMLDVECP